MKWWEFTQDQGDGSYCKRRFLSESEAEAALAWLEENVPHWVGDGDGITMVDSSSKYFFDSLEDIKEQYT